MSTSQQRTENGLSWTVDRNVAFLIFDRPDRRNALSMAMLRQIRDLIQETSGSNSPVRAVVVRSSSPNMFCAGADVKEYAAHADDPAWGMESKKGVEAASEALASCPVPTIVLVDGPCLGAGMSLLTACDIRIATDSSRFGIPSIGLGIFYPFGDTRRLRDRIGAARTRHLLLTASIVKAADALRLGLVDEVVTGRAALDHRCDELISHFRSVSPVATRATKRCIEAAGETGSEPQDLVAIYRAALAAEPYQTHLSAVRRSGAAAQAEHE